MLEHLFHRQRLDTHRLIFTDEACRQLVLKILTAIRNARVQFGDATARFLSILRPFVLAGVTPLQPRQPLFLFAQEAFVAGLLTRRKRHHVMQAQVNANGRGRDGNGARSSSTSRETK